ncbi:unnamed protein product [Adineta steineri]|uniref:Uncharacterized protein n=1 Tax=Adineta steineri TaxID=433720 RepID=A0A814QJQ2_9BILA|nr:unnamed protein product [Adineta steineri]CAF1459053.1 unnamed protein product [Adineta steineri]
MLRLFIFISILVCSSSSLPLSDFFPFGPEIGDSTVPTNDDESVGPLGLPHIFPYFDNNHRQIWVANNGLFSFLSAIPQFTPEPFPLANDQRLVTGFWADIDTRGAVSGIGNKVYYHIYTDVSLTDTTTEVFTKASGYVRSFFPQQRPFEPTMVITGTWYRVGAYSGKTDRLNTFQIVLATDEDRSFVFILYNDLQWAGTSYTSEPYAQAGFNAGDGIAFEMLPYSRTQDIVKLVNVSNVNVPGLFVFRVDTDEIDAGGCSTNISVATVRPRVSSQLGSTAINLQGPCFDNVTIPKCQFGSSSQVVDGIILDDFRAICLTPLAPVHGPVAVSLSIDNGATYIPAGTFTYAPLKFGSDDVIIEMNNEDNLLNLGQYVTLKWRFSESIQNTFPNETMIDIELWKITLNDRSQLQQDNSPVILAQDLQSASTSLRLQLPENIQSITTCFIRVVARSESKKYAGLNTGVLVVRSPSAFASESCVEWSHRQPEPSTWNGGSLLPCPMTRTQAVAGGRCCYESDSQCYRGNPLLNNCWLHQARPQYDEQSAVECYITKGSNQHGAGAECCYDIEGQLITRGTGAGTDDRYQPVSSPVQHFFDDTVPYLQCCMMSSSPDLCSTYMRYRPPRRGSNTMGENGGTWGDPHFTTLDGTSYTFNGYGEYTYLAISENISPPGEFNPLSQNFTFMSQIRTVPLPSNDVTVTKGFAARSNSPESQLVSVIVSRRENPVIRRGNEILQFDDNIDTLFFPEMTIERNLTDRNVLILSWTVGVTIQINFIQITSPTTTLVLNVAASVAGIYRGRTYGLLGTYDGQASNDLRAQNGQIINADSSLEQIHRQFGVTWSIDPITSLFHYETDQSAIFFHEKNQLFTPSFIEPSNSQAEDASIRHACNIDPSSLPASWNIAQRTCYYDISVTKDESFGQTSLNAGNEMLSIKADQRNPPLFDITLPVHKEAKKGDKIQLKIVASSEYPSSVIQLSAIHLPRDAKFNVQTGMFEWTAIEGTEHVRIRAFDMTYNLTATHEIVFEVGRTNYSPTQFEVKILLFFTAFLFAFLSK